MISVTDARKGIDQCHSEPSGAGAGGSWGGGRRISAWLLFAKLSVAAANNEHRNKERQ